MSKKKEKHEITAKEPINPILILAVIVLLAAPPTLSLLAPLSAFLTK